MRIHQWNPQTPANGAHLYHWGIIQVIASPVLISLAQPKVLNDPRSLGAPVILSHLLNTHSNHRYVIYESLVLNYIAGMLIIILCHKHLEDHIMLD
jgi:hypothetical protein